MANDYTPQQIEEILQMFFDLAGTRQYIGARYVPIFGHGRGTSVDWDQSSAYEPLSIVYYQGDTYTSRRYVPAGISIDNQDYWVITGRYNAQVEQYRQEVLTFQDQIDGLRDTMVEDYVPFPDEAHYPKYGTLNQVLTTLADGTTRWQDPVVPSDAQAEEVITAWLDDHPEATTTVEDGSITDAKLSADSSVLRFRGGLTGTAIADTQKAGSYSISQARYDLLVDLPSDAVRGNYMLLNIPYALTGGGSTQYSVQVLIRTADANDTWMRYNSSGASGPWNRVYRQVIGTSDISDGAVTTAKLSSTSPTMFLRGPLTGTSLRDKAEAGAYYISSARFDLLTDAPSNATSGYYTLFNVPYAISGENVQYSHQFLMKNVSTLQIWDRYISSGATGDWHQIYPCEEVMNASITPAKMAFRPNVLTGKKLVTAGDSYTSASFGSDNPNTGHNYGWYVAQRNGMTFVNSGISGSIMAYDKTYVDDPDNVSITTKNPFSYQRYLNVPTDTDYLTIWFGINDASHTYLGTIDDTTSDTFYGAWNKVLEYYLTNRPFMHVGLIVTVKSTTAYRQAVRDVAAKWGYPVLDLVQGSDTPAFFTRDGMSQAATDLRLDAFGANDWNGHPNPEWHDFISSAYEEFLKRC